MFVVGLKMYTGHLDGYDNMIYSSIIGELLFKIISKHGMKCQFGSTSKIGRQDNTFTINTLLHLLHNQNLPTWVEISDPVKAIDTYNHEIIILILKKYDAAPRIC